MEGARRTPGGTRGMGRGRIRTRSPTGGRPGARSPDRAAAAAPSSSSSSALTTSTEISHAVAAMKVSESTSAPPVAVPATGYPRGAARGVKHQGDVGESGGYEDPNYVVSRPPGKNKQGQKGNPLDLTANYYKLKSPPAWCLYHYDVTFDPEQDSNSVKRRIIRKMMDTIEGGFLFDGKQLFLSKQIDSETCRVEQDAAKDGTPREAINVTIKFIKQVDPGSPVYMQLYNLLVRKVMFALELKEMGRHFFDPNAIIKVPSQRLQLWPGFITSMRNYEQDVLLCVEINHKVIREDSVLDIIRTTERNARGDAKAAILAEFKNTVVMTTYNNETYHVDDVDFTKNPESTFDYKGTPISFVEYYKRKGITIRDMKQPLIVSNPSKKDLHRGLVGDKLLVPELCRSTGLTDAMRSNFTLMKELGKYLHQQPHERAKVIEDFMKRLRTNERISTELKRWGFEFDTKPVSVKGRQLPMEKMIFKTGEQSVDEKGDFTLAFRTHKMLSAIDLNNWAILVPQRDQGGVDNLVRTMVKVGKPLDMNISNPGKIIPLPNTSVQSYLRALGDLLGSNKNIQMIFVILPNNKLETYAAVKKLLAREKGILSQCFVAKNVQSKGLMSIATKVVVQMNAKLGGEPWSIKLPMKNTMFIGFDVYHGAKGSKGGSIGAMVASYSPNFTKYYSVTSVFKDDTELAKNIGLDVKKCLEAFLSENGCLPERIFLYRDGVSDGQIKHVFCTEVVQLKEALTSFYKTQGQDSPKLTFIVVTKRINTRLLQIRSNGALANPGPGTVADDVVTLPERYDFFLISCAARQGTVSPCSYNVLHDESGFDADRIQLITYKLCHMYFNWSGTIAVPAPCQYAHKLAFLSGMAYGGHAHPDLAKNLHFL